MSQLRFAQLTGLLMGLAAVGTTLAFHGAETVNAVFASKLAHVPGHTLTANVVVYPPGGKSSIHHHAGSVFAYVLSGNIRSQNSATGPAKIYKAGEFFFEPPGSAHLVSENASATEPARLLAIHVATDGAVLTKLGNVK